MIMKNNQKNRRWCSCCPSCSPPWWTPTAMPPPSQYSGLTMMSISNVFAHESLYVEMSLNCDFEHFLVWPLGSNLDWQECICFIGSLIWFGLSMNPLRLASAFVGCCLWKFDSIILRAAGVKAWSFFSHINRLNPEGPHFTLPAIRVRLLFRIAVLPQKHFIKTTITAVTPHPNWILSFSMHTLT